MDQQTDQVTRDSWGNRMDTRVNRKTGLLGTAGVTGTDTWVGE
jgi:hypothetical protein